MNNIGELVMAKINLILSVSKLDNDMAQMVTSLWDRQEAGPAHPGRFKWANLTLASCEFVSGKAEIALTGAAAMELFALAADILDDIQDQDNKDLPWCKITAAQAINLAACLLVLSYKTLSALADLKLYKDVSEILSQTGLNACAGQYQEHLYENEADFTTEQYLKIAEKKSGSLTGCACMIGAIMAGALQETVEKLGEFGVNLGVIAQIENDLKDIINIETKSDLAGNKKTLPLIYLVNTLQGEKAKELKNLILLAGLNLEKFGPEKKERLRKIVYEEGAAHYCLVIQEIFRQKAMNLLEQISVPHEQKGKLMNLVRENR